MKQVTLHIIFLLLCESVCAQLIFPETLDRPHPRLISEDVDHSYLMQQIQDNSEVKLDYEGFKGQIDGYVNQHVTDPQWMVSRLQMYWKTHSTDAFIKGGIYSHADVPVALTVPDRLGPGRAVLKVGKELFAKTIN